MKEIGTRKRTGKLWFLLLYILVSMALSYIAILFAACYSPGINIIRWFSVFNEFVINEGNFLVGFTEVTPILIFVFLAAWSLIFLLIVSKPFYPYKGREYGSSHFQDPKFVTKKYSNKKKKNEVIIKPGDEDISDIKINTHNRWISENVYVDIDNKKTSNLNTIVIGPPGTGKSFRFARPVLSGLNGNYIVTDPKGELYTSTSQFFKDNGYEVMVSDVRDKDGMNISVKFNPFSYMESDKDINEMVDILMRSTTGTDEVKTDPFWPNAENLFFTSLFQLIFYSYPKDKQNWNSLINLIDLCEMEAGRNGDVKANDLLREMEKHNLLWLENHKKNHPAYQNLKDILGGAFETVSGVIMSAKVRIKSMKNEAALSMMDEDEIDIVEKFGKSVKTKESPTGKRILYIITKEGDRSMNWYVSLLYMTMFNVLYNYTDKSESKSLPEHLTFLMDEFANITLPTDFPHRLSTMRSRNMSAIVIVQTLLQLKEKYPNNKMDEQMMGLFSFQVLLGAPDPNVAEYYSKMLGTTTIYKEAKSSTDTWDHAKSQAPTTNVDIIKKELLPPDELLKLDRNFCIIIIGGDNPVLDDKIKFEKSSFYKLLCRKDPFVPKRAVKKRPQCIYSGKDAEAILFDAKKEGVRVITLSEKDLSDMALLDIKEASGFIYPKDEMDKNRLMFEKNLSENQIDFLDYSPKQAMVVQKLLNRQFSVRQIKAFDLLIREYKTLEEITDIFNPDMSVEDIKRFLAAYESGRDT